MRSIAVMVSSTSVIILGCSIHPLPQDYSRYSTVKIVTKIRCEAREAIIEHATKEPSKFDKELNHVLSEKTDRDARLNAVKADLIVETLREAEIGYGFKFTISEKDGGSIRSNFIFPFGNGKTSLNLGIGEDKERKSDRIFDIKESFAAILIDEPLGNECALSPKWKYPITGSIGLSEVVETYVQLAKFQFGKFAKPTGGGGGAGGGGGDTGGSDRSRDVSDFSDVLTFTTTYSGSVSPTIELSPVSHDFRLASATANLGGERKDIHSVTIALVKDSRGSGSNKSVFGVSGGAVGDNNIKSILRERRLLDSLQRGDLF